MIAGNRWIKLMNDNKKLLNLIKLTVAIVLVFFLYHQLNKSLTKVDYSRFQFNYKVAFFFCFI